MLRHRSAGASALKDVVTDSWELLSDRSHLRQMVIGGFAMQFTVHLRDGATFRIEAAYIEVVAAGQSSYTFLGPVPGYPMAIVAAFPVDLVAGVLPTNPPVAKAPPRPARAASAGSPPTAGEAPPATTTE